MAVPDKRCICGDYHLYRVALFTYWAKVAPQEMPQGIAAADGRISVAESSCTGGVDPRAGAGLPGLHAISCNIPVISFAREDSLFGASLILE